MVLEFIPGQTVEGIEVNTKMIRSMDLVFTLGLMEDSTVVFGTEESSMD